jgi:hypothetical protein
MDPATYAFLAANKWWLEHDAYFLGVLCGQPGALNPANLEDILRTYGAARSMPLDQRADYINLIANSQQAENMALVGRADLIAATLGNLERPAVSAFTKVSWFIWPAGWTMFDSHASHAVLGHANGAVIPRMLLFYAALEERGWGDLILGVRAVLNRSGFDERLAERTVDKYLWLTHALHNLDPNDQRDPQGRHEAFRNALPQELVGRIAAVNAAVTPLLQNSNLLHPG